MRSYLLCMLAGVLLFPFSALQAQNIHDLSSHSVASADVYHSQGVVKKIAPGSLSIAHQAIPALNWPPMTMQFALMPANKLPQVNEGDTVSFTFVESEQGYQIVSLTPQK